MRCGASTTSTRPRCSGRIAHAFSKLWGGARRNARAAEQEAASGRGQQRGREGGFEVAAATVVWNKDRENGRVYGWDNEFGAPVEKELRDFEVSKMLVSNAPRDRRLVAAERAREVAQCDG